MAEFLVGNTVVGSGIYTDDQLKVMEREKAIGRLLP